MEEAGFPPKNIALYLEAAERVAEHEADVFFAASGEKSLMIKVRPCFM